MQGITRTLVVEPVRWLDVKGAATPSPREPYVALDGEGQTRTGFLVRNRLITSLWHGTAPNQWGPWGIAAPAADVRSVLSRRAIKGLTLYIAGANPRSVQWRLDPNA